YAPSLHDALPICRVEMAKKNPAGGQPAVQPHAPQVASRMSLAALILGVLALPAGLLPLIGIFVAMIALVVSIIALIRANRHATARTYPIVGLVLAILALGLALITTTAATEFPAHCPGVSDGERTHCVMEHQGNYLYAGSSPGVRREVPRGRKQEVKGLRQDIARAGGR